MATGLKAAFAALRRAGVLATFANHRRDYEAQLRKAAARGYVGIAYLDEDDSIAYEPISVLQGTNFSADAQRLGQTINRVLRDHGVKTDWNGDGAYTIGIES